MSVDLFVHARKPHPLRDDKVTKELSRKGWHVFFLEPSGLRESAHGALRDHLIYGAKTRAALDEARELVRSRREKELERRLQTELLAVCGLAIIHKPSQPDEHGDSLSRKLLSLLKATKAIYCLRTSAGRSSASIALQNAVWEAIGKLSGGVLEDPQEPGYYSFGARGRKTLWKPDDMPMDVLGIYFRAAKAKGFPVELQDSKDNEEIHFHPEQLSEANLEKFLRFTKNHPWPDAEYGLGMIGMILDEYKFNKGPAFVLAKDKWLAELQRKYGG